MPKIIENAKQIILDEARKVLLSKNYKELNIRDIARTCGIGIGTFYNYFSNKKELTVEIFRQDWVNTLTLMEELKYTDESFKEKLRKIYLSLECFTDKYMVIFFEIAKEEGYEKKSHYSFNEFHVKLRELIELEKQRGFISSTLDSQKLCYFIASNLIYLSKSRYMSYDELFDSMKI